MAKKKTAVKQRNRVPKQERLDQFKREFGITPADEQTATRLSEEHPKKVLRLAVMLKAKEGAGSRAREIKQQYGVSAFVAKAAAHIEKTLGKDQAEQFLKANA